MDCQDESLTCLLYPNTVLLMVQQFLSHPPSRLFLLLGSWQSETWIFLLRLLLKSHLLAVMYFVLSSSILGLSCVQGWSHSGWSRAISCSTWDSWEATGKCGGMCDGLQAQESLTVVIYSINHYYRSKLLPGSSTLGRHLPQPPITGSLWEFWLVLLSPWGFLRSPTRLETSGGLRHLWDPRLELPLMPWSLCRCCIPQS